MKKRTERWRPVVGFENDYAVSDLGRVVSFRRGERRILRAGLTSAGYPSVVLGRRKTKLVHRLVAEAFIGPCPEGQVVRHKDGHRDNCGADNLEYGTRAQNMEDAKAHGTYQKGKCKCCKIPPSQRGRIRRLYASGQLTQKEIGKIYGVTDSAICLIVGGKRANIY